MNGLGDMILAARAAAGRDAGVADAKALLSDRELVAVAREIGASVKRESGTERPVVAVCLPLSADAVAQLVAAILGDYVVCFLDPSAPAERREAILEALAPHALVDGAGIRRRDGARTDDVAEAGAGYLAMSSGSTGGAPKAVLSTWAALAAFAGPGAASLELDATACWGEISHPAYDMAMTNLLLALSSGSAVRVSGSLGDRLRPLRFADRARATHVRLAPRFADLAGAEQRHDHALRVWGSGGDRFQVAHLAQLFAAGIPLVVNTYGTSETTGFASTATLTSADGLADVHGSVPIGRGVVGEWRTDLTGEAQMLRIRSPHLPRGYLFGDAGEYPRWESADAVLTGDVGARVGDDLYCLGRAGRRVKRNGSFVDLDEIDAVLRDAKDIVSFTVLTRSGELISIVEQPETQLSGVRRDLAGLLRPEVLPDELVPVRQLPRLDNGKIDHVAALALVQSAIS